MDKFHAAALQMIALEMMAKTGGKKNCEYGEERGGEEHRRTTYERLNIGTNEQEKRIP
jgi:hypothetical protein